MTFYTNAWSFFSLTKGRSNALVGKGNVYFTSVGKGDIYLTLVATGNIYLTLLGKFNVSIGKSTTFI